ncbi:MAG TPA: ABC transporter ATP-binding protein [Actinomycetes bacterium]|jgi:ABC-type polysaccharide/polyol phosphate transport system ATPase subunit|nr:ABC transporter ATP-binding protein [Actinomycetes bacterium]
MRRGEIAAARVWKRFRADRQRMLLRDQLDRISRRVTGRSNAHGWRWALRDVDMAIGAGESVGLIGPNGSGKTTMLRLLAKVMYPYAGSVAVGGRVGALIDVRAGIHPDLTGAENVYLYGSLLGVSRREVARRFDDIVAFGELESAINRQVKFYSTGMHVRLGFAIAAFTEPDVLLVDEVLAVGDAAFQQKCLDRMRAVLAQGTTVIFVSHDLQAVESICERAIWLREGTVEADGPVRQVLSGYRRTVEQAAEITAPAFGVVRVVKSEIRGAGGGTPQSQGPMEIKLVLESPEPLWAGMSLGVSEGPATPIFLLGHEAMLPPGQTELRCSVPFLPLPRGRFYLWFGIIESTRDLVPWHPVCQFEVLGPELIPTPRGVLRLAPIQLTPTWEVDPR